MEDMMSSPEPRFGVVYEHPAWFAPLFAELDRREIPHDRIDLSAHAFDPDRRAVPWSLVLNRLSPSAYLRGHGQTIAYGREFLRYLETTGTDVVNGSDAFALEISKVAQVLLLQRLGLRAPRTRVINHPSQAPAADLCPIDLPKVALKVEGYTPPEAVVQDVVAITRAARLDLGGVEYLVNDRDGDVSYYDINALSNFVTDAVRVVGFNPYAALVDYLVARSRLRQPVSSIA